MTDPRTPSILSIPQFSNHSKSDYIFVVGIGLAMAFVAGYSNGVCLSGFIHVNTMTVKQSVAGVTGVYTQSADAIGQGDLETFGFMVGTIFSVMVGSCIASIINPRPVAFELSPRYGPIFMIGSLFSALGAFAAIHNYRREFYFTAIANGIMNGVSSMYGAASLVSKRQRIFDSIPSSSALHSSLRLDVQLSYTPPLFMM